MTTVKTVQANYTEAQCIAMVAAYNGGNGDSIEKIASDMKKSVPSVRAKLASLKVYVSKAAKTDTSDKKEKANKETLAAKLSELVGVTLLNVEAASKPALLALINAINQRDEKIQSLIDDMLGDDDASQDDASQDDVSQDDVSQDDVSQDDVSQDDVSQDDVSQ